MANWESRRIMSDCSWVAGDQDGQTWLAGRRFSSRSSVTRERRELCAAGRARDRAKEACGPPFRKERTQRHPSADTGKTEAQTAGSTHRSFDVASFTVLLPFPTEACSLRHSQSSVAVFFSWLFLWLGPSSRGRSFLKVNDEMEAGKKN